MKRNTQFPQFGILLFLSLLATGCQSPNDSDSPPTVSDPPPVSGHDGTSEQGQLLVLGQDFSGKVGASTDPENQTSYYKFTPTESDSYLLQFSETSPKHLGGYPVKADQQYFNLYLMDSSGDVLKNFYASESVSPVWHLEADQTYTISVTNAAKNTQAPPTTYHLKIDKENELPRSESRYLGTIPQQGLELPMYVSTGAESYYSFELAAGSTLDITYPAGAIDAYVDGPDPDTPDQHVRWAEESWGSEEGFSIGIGNGNEGAVLHMFLYPRNGTVDARFQGPLRLTYSQ